MPQPNSVDKSNTVAKTASVFALKSLIKIVVIVLLSIVLIRVTTYVYTTTYEIFRDKPNITGEKREYTINIEKDMPLSRIAEILYINGIIKDKTQFNVQAKLGGLSKSINIGSHKLNSYMTGEEIIRELSQPGVVINDKK